MRMYQYDKQLDFHAPGREIKRKREEKGWTQEYLARLVDRVPRSIMYIENRDQHPSLNTFYQLVTLLDISVDQFFFQTPTRAKALVGNRLIYCSTQGMKKN